VSNYRRWYRAGATDFFAVVTHQRRPILTTETGRLCLRLAIQQEQADRPFEQNAIVLLPNHLHTVWTLPEGDSDFSTRWAAVKKAFTEHWLARGGAEGATTRSRRRRRERGVWQRRFWEHLCRDADDLKRFLDYLHWNPVKHGLVSRARDWPWSTFQQFVDLGEYDADWGTVDPWPEYDDPEWE
jgi:putative transposase